MCPGQGRVKARSLSRGGSKLHPRAGSWHRRPSIGRLPVLAAAVARAVSEGRFDRGVLVCGSGIGMAITANKVPGIRAAAIGDTTVARLLREHNDLNVLTLGARATTQPLANEILRAFLDTPFEGGRHEGRVRKIQEMERS